MDVALAIAASLLASFLLLIVFTLKPGETRPPIHSTPNPKPPQGGSGTAPIRRTTLDPQDFIPDFSLLTPEDRAACGRHLSGLATIYAKLTKTKLDDFVASIFDRAVGPAVIGDVQSLLAGAPVLPGIDPATLLVLFQVVQKLFELWAKR